MKELLPHHLDDLRRSGLSDATIRAAGLYSEASPDRLSKILHWEKPATNLGASLVFPFVDVATGEFNCFARVKPDKPRSTGGKYEQPRGMPIRAYIPRGAIEAIKGLEPIGLVEGEKKALAATQSGLPCIGLTGVWGWQKTREKDAAGKGIGNRELIDDLTAIAWEGRSVWIGFDFDHRRNPNVNMAAAELARVLSEHGAIVIIVRLPAGGRDSSGVPTKMAVDDFLVAYGEDALRQLIRNQMRPTLRPKTLTDYRAELARVRVDSLCTPGVYTDTSPPGAGKTHADMAAIKLVKKSLTILPTHKNCREVEKMYKDQCLDAVAFPKIDSETCQNLPDAERAIASGLSASGAVCPTCPFRIGCEYHARLEAVEAAAHRIATHHRAGISFERLSKNPAYVAVHEDAVAVLRPGFEIGRGLEDISRVADAAISIVTRPRFAFNSDRSEEHFLHRIYIIAEQLAETLRANLEAGPLDLPFAAGAPPNIDSWLYKAMLETGVWPAAEPMHLVKLLAAGEIAQLTLRVNEVFLKGGEKQVSRSIVGIRQTVLPDKAAIWVADATADTADIESMTGRPVIDATPEGRLARQHPLLQIPLDITKRTKKATVVSIIESLLDSLPYNRFGVICHREHVTTIDGRSQESTVGNDYRSRITCVDHFRSGASRGSNAWIDKCDCLLVLGTPRVPINAIKGRLCAIGLHMAATRAKSWVEWGADWWSGLTVSGRRMTVRTLAYRDHEWHRAHRAIVRAELIQAAGRGRSIAENGIPTLLVTTENLDLPLFEFGLEALDASDRKAVLSVGRASDISAKYIY